MKRIITTIIVLLTLSFTVKAQQGLYDYKDFTPYEKQRSDLADEAGKKVYDAMSEQDKLGFAMLSMSAANNSKNDYELMLNIENMLCTIFGVASLTNPEQASTYYEYRLTNQMKTIAKWYFDERAKIEKQKTWLDITREKDRLIGFYVLKQNIKEAFLKWSTKGTYEKREQYLTRIQIESISSFDSICQKLCMKHYFDNSRFQTLPYDVDNELYSIKIYYTVDNKETSYIILSTNIGVKQAKEYKDDHYFTYMSDRRWCPLSFYLHNGFFHSKQLVDLETTYYYDAAFEPTDKVVISYDELAIDNSDLNLVLQGHLFDYNKYMTQKLKKLDSIHKITSKIGKKLDNLNNLIGKGPWGTKDGLHDEWYAWKRVYYNPIKYINNPSELTSWYNEILDDETKTINYIRQNLNVYRLSFDSDNDFIDFFYNEKEINLVELQQKIKGKFDEYSATISNAKQLRRSKDEPIGQKMLQFCAMTNDYYTRYYIEQYTRYETDVFLVSDYVENMLKEYVLKNKVLKKKFDSNNSKYASFIIARYVIEGK